MQPEMQRQGRYKLKRVMSSTELTEPHGLLKAYKFRVSRHAVTDSRTAKSSTRHGETTYDVRWVSQMSSLTARIMVICVREVSPPDL